MYSTVSGYYLENDRKGVVHAENLDNMYGTISDYLGNALERNSKCQKQICKLKYFHRPTVNSKDPYARS